MSSNQPSIRPRLRRGPVATALLAVVLSLACLAGPAAAADPVVVAVGDVACGAPRDPVMCRDAETADLASALSPNAILALGDLQYENGDLESFNAYYDKTWGRLKSITRPVPGNHEYRVAGAQGYFDYFNGVGNQTGRAATRGKGWYSFNLGSWHVVALNSNCGHVGGCHAGSEQEQWLRQDLAASTSPCTMAFWHHPRWSSDATHHGTSSVAPLVQALYDDRVDVMLAGHAHVYERMAPQTPDKVMDGATGITQFTVGTGGRSEYSFSSFEPNSLVRGTGAGVLRLGLHGDYYDWRFAGTPDTAIADQGAKLCHRAPRPNIRTLRFPATGDATVRADQPDVPDGGSPVLTARAAPATRAYLKFDVNGLNGGKVTAAYLSMWVTDGSPGSGTVYRVADTGWPEATLSWANRPALGRSHGSLGAVTAGRWVYFPVKSAITGDGPVSFALTSAQSDAVAYAAREGGPDHAPRLRVHVEAPDSTPPTAPGVPVATAVTGESAQLAWSASTDAIGVAGYRVYRNGSPRASTAATTFADTGLAPSTTYRYTVTAYDATFNESAPSEEVVVTTPAPPDLDLRFTPTDDTFVAELEPTSAFSIASTTIYDGDPVRRAFLRFDVSGLPVAGASRAVLRLRAENPSVTGGTILEVPDSNWTERTTTWLTQPAALTAPIGQFGAHNPGDTLEFDVTAAVRGNGPVSFRIDGGGSDGGGFWSTNSPPASDGSSRAAQLVVTPG